MFLQKSSSFVFSLALTTTLMLQAQEAMLPPTSPEKTAITAALTELTGLGGNTFYIQALSPGISLSVTKTEAERKAETNAMIAEQMQAVISAFKSADESNKLAATRAAVESIDRDILRKGVKIEFINGEPSNAISRSFMMIEKQPGSTLTTAEQTMKAITSYRRSARPSDHAYEYSMAENLQTSTITHTEGSDQTWRPPLAPPALSLREDKVIKKCRNILGWRCATALYRADEALEGADHIKFLFTSSYSLKNNRDNAQFSGGKAKNQVDGSTGLLVVKESENWIMVFAIDSQLKEGRLSFTGAIQSGSEEDFARFKQRIAMDLQISADKIK